MQKQFLSISFVLLLNACHFNVKIERDVVNTIAENTAEKFVYAYNAHDIQKMLSMVHDEIKFMYIDGPTVYIETNSKIELAQFLVKFFEQKPTAKSEVVSSYQNSRFIHQIEKALWQNNAGEQKAQCSLSVYELKDDLIINVWYHQAYQCAVSDN